MANGTVHLVSWEVPPGSDTLRRFAVCETPVEGTERGWCGALVDVTDWPEIRATADCGVPANHRLTGMDRVVPTL